MYRLTLTIGLFILVAPGVFVAGPTAAPLNQIKLNGHVFTLPPGFTIELVAGTPLVKRPITASFDELGRLYVADSSGSNENVQEQLKKKPHRIVRLEDSKGTGKFDQATVFADKMMFPEGTLWHNGSLYVAAPPSIWKLTDTDGDGVADQRVEWFKGKTLTGCANDLHGPYLGPDGWIYWCKGAFAKQTYELPGKKPFVTRAAHVFRAKPDGTSVEPVMTGGMDNPVGLAFSPEGERFFSCTFFQYPGGGKRDGLVHALYGGVYGKDHDVIYEHPWTGPTFLPPLTHLGPAAPAGMLRYQSAAFGKDYQNNLFVSCFNLQKVSRHVLIPKGATFDTKDEDFLVSDNKDFHPTDVVEDADGSLLVIDTGGWYKLCCPSSQLVKPDVLGAIYRVRPTVAAPVKDDPRGLKVAWNTMSPKELAQLLGDERPAVRERAVEAMAARSEKALDALEQTIAESKSHVARLQAAWAAIRIEGPKARAVVRSAATSHDVSVVKAALHGIALWRDREAIELLVPMLKEERDPAVRRVLAEALGRLGDKEAVPSLLKAFLKETDRALEHSLIYALIEIGDAESTAAVLKSANPLWRRPALTALDQMGAKLDPAALSVDLKSADPRLRATAWWILGRHPEWAASLQDNLRERLSDKDLSREEVESLLQNLAKLARSSAVQKLLADLLVEPRTEARTKHRTLDVMARAGLKQAPDSWFTALSRVLDQGDSALIMKGVDTLRALSAPKQFPAALTTALLEVARDTDSARTTRLQALAALPGSKLNLDADLFRFVDESLDRDQEQPRRAAAAEVLSRAALSTDQLIALTVSLKSAGPMEINRVLDAFANSNDERVGKALLDALAAAPAKSSLRVGDLKPRLAKYSSAIQKQAETLFVALDKEGTKQKEKLDHLVKTLEPGDVRRGMVVFNSAKAACISCHAVGYVGGTLGPDLTRIGKIRTDRDLLEAIVFPSVSFVRGYEPVVVTTRDGKVYNGVLKKDASDEVVLALAPNQEARLAREDIDLMQPSSVSVMPSGLDQQLTPRELADLVAFLKANK